MVENKDEEIQVKPDPLGITLVFVSATAGVDLCPAFAPGQGIFLEGRMAVGLCDVAVIRDFIQPESTIFKDSL